jgi:AcrR family transcriptional regulator
MAHVNPQRRAEIGLERRRRARAAILEAARACYAAPTAVPVTVDGLMQAAGLAKGTFYGHFPDLAELETELGAALVQELDDRLPPSRAAVEHPLTRLATAVTMLLTDLAASPARARLVARAIAAVPNVGPAMRAHLRQDLADAHASGLLATGSVELSATLVTALTEWAARELGDGRVDGRAVPDLVRAILPAVGCAPRDAALRADQAARRAEKFLRRPAAPVGAPA